MIHATILVLHGHINNFLFVLPMHYLLTFTSMFFTIPPLLIRDKKARKAKGKGRLPRGYILICSLLRAAHPVKREKGKMKGEGKSSPSSLLIIANYIHSNLMAGIQQPFFTLFLFRKRKPVLKEKREIFFP